MKLAHSPGNSSPPNPLLLRRTLCAGKLKGEMAISAHQGYYVAFSQTGKGFRLSDNNIIGIDDEKL